MLEDVKKRKEAGAEKDAGNIFACTPCWEAQACYRLLTWATVCASYKDSSSKAFKKGFKKTKAVKSGKSKKNFNDSQVDSNVRYGITVKAPVRILTGHDIDGRYSSTIEDLKEALKPKTLQLCEGEEPAVIYADPSRKPKGDLPGLEADIFATTFIGHQEVVSAFGSACRPGEQKEKFEYLKKATIQKRPEIVQGAGLLMVKTLAELDEEVRLLRKGRVDRSKASLELSSQST